LDVEVTFSVNRLQAVDGPLYKLPIYHYHADHYDGSSVWLDKGKDPLDQPNNMTKREGLITKGTPFIGAEFNAVKFINNSAKQPYLQ
jgi:hypothetical protein